MKLSDQIKDKAKELLGGKNVTARRMESLLEEVAELRAKSADAPPVAPGPMPAEMLGLPERMREDLAASLSGPLPVALTAPEVPADPAPPTTASAPDWAEERKLLYASLDQMQKKIEDMEKRTSKEDVDQAVGAGKLPITSIPAPPLGYQGLGDIPVGTWIRSPLGPPVNFIICGCGKCTSHRLIHWFCSVCKQGPFDYRGRIPHYSKNHMAPGGVWGIAHNACSEPCRMSYLASLGVAPGLNDHEPPQVVREGEVPGRPAIAHDSD